MSKKYAIRITEHTLDLIQVMSPWGRPTVQETNTFFLFTVDSTATTTDHDIVDEVHLRDYDGNDKTPRIVLQ